MHDAVKHLHKTDCWMCMHVPSSTEGPVVAAIPLSHQKFGALNRQNLRSNNVTNACNDAKNIASLNDYYNRIEIDREIKSYAQIGCVPGVSEPHCGWATCNRPHNIPRCAELRYDLPHLINPTLQGPKRQRHQFMITELYEVTDCINLVQMIPDPEDIIQVIINSQSLTLPTGVFLACGRKIYSYVLNHAEGKCYLAYSVPMQSQRVVTLQEIQVLDRRHAIHKCDTTRLQRFFEQKALSTALKDHINSKDRVVTAISIQLDEVTKVALQKHLAFDMIPASTRGGASATLSTPRQSTLAEFGKRMSKATTEKLTNSIAKWVAADCRPISIVEDEGLKEAFQIASSDPNFQLPSRTTVMKRIHQLYGDERNTKEEKLAGACHVTLTGDHWTSVSNHNYLGVTAHLINNEWKLKSFALTVSKTVTRHYADACAEQFDAVIKEWEIENKVTTIGSEETWLQQHANCLSSTSHVLHICCKEPSHFDTALAKCRKIVGHFKHSPASTEELHQQQTALGQAREPLVQDISTRWNSTLSMISRYLRNQEAVNATLARQKHNLATLTNLENVTELLGGDTYVSCSVVLPALCHLNRVMNPTDEDPGYMIKFKATFSKDLDTRMATINNRWLKVATALDPRFKDLKSIHKNERNEVWTWIEEMLRGSEAGPAAPQPTEDEPAAKKSLLLLCSSDSDSDKEELGPLAHYKAEPCIGMHECPLEWWAAHAGAYGQLSSLARKYLATPATSVPCERLFSLAGNIIQKKRAALHSDNVNKLVCLSNWLKKA
ncbi:Zinc finger BED domain-containing protein 1 [Merluccius polli]|uniref:Zinc finger BED domain-containing protein 1 n=1 Tax=Merluccius polli TaxID=89951 RepID=A0AA47MLD7_MERPO|nr:Zinc finger BED domain-containing protein 1 [Merluccius polli]